MNRCIAVVNLLLVTGLFFPPPLRADEQNAVQNTAQCEQGRTTCTSIAQPKTAERFIAYYFHGNQRCPTCSGIQANAERVIRQSFAKELQAGKLVWRVVNFDEPNNKHFISDFNLYSSSLVIVDEQAGSPTRSVNLEQVWPLAHSESAFDIYVAEEIRKFIGSSDG